MVEIVKLGYMELTFDRMYAVVSENLSIYALQIVLGEKEKVKKRLKNELSFYYPKDALLKESINPTCILINEDYEENSIYKVVPIPQKELETILLKNQLCGYRTYEEIMQDKEFDVIFDTFYPKLIDFLMI